MAKVSQRNAEWWESVRKLWTTPQPNPEGEHRRGVDSILVPRVSDRDADEELPIPPDEAMANRLGLDESENRDRD